LLRKTTFTDKKVGEYFNTNFVNTSVDAEKGEGVEIAAKYHIEGYPTLLILDKDGKELGRQVGYMPAEGLLRFGQSVKK
jgi:thioredoxin-related protein